MATQENSAHADMFSTPKLSRKRQSPSSAPSSRPSSNTKSASAFGTPVEVLTPLANLKVLMSAVSPDLKEKERKEKEMKVQKAARDIFTSSEQSVTGEVSSLNVTNVPTAATSSSSTSNTKGGRKHEPDYDRKSKSLALLCRRFLQLAETEMAPGTSFNLEAVATKLDVNRRRIYDIVNVLESMEMTTKMGKNSYTWNGSKSLPLTLAKLKAIVSYEGATILCDKAEVLNSPEFLWQMKGSGLLVMNQGEADTKSQEKTLVSSDPPQGSSLSSHPIVHAIPNHVATSSSSPCSSPVVQDEEEGNNVSGKSERSLGYLCQKFIMLILVLPKHEVTLDFAADVILADDETIDMSGKPKRKVRRLYDISNVLVSMGLISKDSYISTYGGFHKPGFYWIGPDMSDVSHIRVSRKCDPDEIKLRKLYQKSGIYFPVRKQLYGSKHSLLNCYNFEVLEVAVPADETAPISKRSKPHSAPSSPVIDKETTSTVSTSMNPLELEAQLFKHDIKHLEGKYPNIWSLFNEFLKLNSTIQNKSHSEITCNLTASNDKNEPVYIFNNSGSDASDQPKLANRKLPKKRNVIDRYRTTIGTPTLKVSHLPNQPQQLPTAGAVNTVLVTPISSSDYSRFSLNPVCSSLSESAQQKVLQDTLASQPIALPITHILQTTAGMNQLPLQTTSNCIPSFVNENQSQKVKTLVPESQHTFSPSIFLKIPSFLLASGGGTVEKDQIPNPESAIHEHLPLNAGMEPSFYGNTTGNILSTNATTSSTEKDAIILPQGKSSNTVSSSVKNVASLVTSSSFGSEVEIQSTTSNISDESNYDRMEIESPRVEVDTAVQSSHSAVLSPLCKTTTTSISSMPSSTVTSSSGATSLSTEVTPNTLLSNMVNILLLQKYKAALESASSLSLSPSVATSQSGMAKTTASKEIRFTGISQSTPTVTNGNSCLSTKGSLPRQPLAELNLRRDYPSTSKQSGTHIPSLQEEP